MLLEAQLAGAPVRLEVGSRADRVRATVAGRGYLLDLAAAAVIDGLKRLAPSAAEVEPPGTLEQWSEGPVVADYGTTYHVLIVGERICGEAMVVPWMTRFTQPLARSLILLERTLPELAPRPEPGCGRLGFAAFERNGFPMIAGVRAQPLFQVARLRFDHYPSEADFALPGEPITCAAPPCPPGASPAP